MCHRFCRQELSRYGPASAAFVLALLPAVAFGQVTAQARSGQVPPWSKGIVPISPESYYNAIECGKQGGADPPCVFWDTGLCKNPHFALTFYTAYKAVAYEVWQAVTRKQPAPKPNYVQAQRTRVTIAIMPAPGSRNPLTDLMVRHGGRSMTPLDRSVSVEGGRFTFDYPAFAPSADVTLDLVGQSNTISCRIPREVLATFR
jgi:hypothetical protein